MTREEYIKQNNEDTNKMSIENLRAYSKRIDTNAQTYFREWQKAESQNKELIKALQWFCDRVDNREIRSKKTYAKFKELLKTSK